VKAGIFFDRTILPRILAKRRRKAAAEAIASGVKSSFSKSEKCRGSARVGRRRIIGGRSKVHE
jgi:hypothetical protein